MALQLQTISLLSLANQVTFTGYAGGCMKEGEMSVYICARDFERICKTEGNFFNLIRRVKDLIPTRILLQTIWLIVGTKIGALQKLCGCNFELSKFMLQTTII